MERCNLCCRVLSDEFQLKNLKADEDAAAANHINWVVRFGHDSNRCITSLNAYLAFRAFNFLLMFAVRLWSFILEAKDGDGGYWFIYLTHWGLMLEVAYLGFACYTTYSIRDAANWVADDDDGRIDMPWFARVAWVLQGIILPGSFMIFAMYWGLVFNGTVHAVSVFTHGVNFVVMAADFLVGSQPYLLLHGLYFFGFALTFLVWSGIHYAAEIGNEFGNRYIYSSLDWGNAGGTSTLAFIILLIVVPLVNLIFWCCVHTRDFGTKSKVSDGQGATQAV